MISLRSKDISKVLKTETFRFNEATSHFYIIRDVTTSEFVERSDTNLYREANHHMFSIPAKGRQA